MKMIVAVALALVAVAVAAPVELEPPKIVSYKFDSNPEGQYFFKYMSEDGSERAENGELKEVRDENNEPRQVVVVRGSYTYTDPQGNIETVNYTADENGYKAEGPSVPRAATR